MHVRMLSYRKIYRMEEFNSKDHDGQIRWMKVRNNIVQLWTETNIQAYNRKGLVFFNMPLFQHF